MREQGEEVRGSWMMRRSITKELDEGDPRIQEKSPQPVARKREGECGCWFLSPNAQPSPKASAASLSLASPLWLATGPLSLY